MFKKYLFIVPFFFPAAFAAAQTFAEDFSSLDRWSLGEGYKIVVENRSQVLADGNDFTMKGSLRIGPGVRESMSWESSKVRRVYALAAQPNTDWQLTQGSVVVAGGRTDANGNAEFSINFDDANWSKEWDLKVGSKKIKVSFFTATPIDFSKLPAKGMCGPTFILLLAMLPLVKLSGRTTLLKAGL